MSRPYVKLATASATTKLPIKFLQPSQSIPAEPPRILTGPLTDQDRKGKYLSLITDFSGPLGQEWMAPGSSRQGYRSGALSGVAGYLMLPAGPSLKITAHETSPVLNVGPSGPWVSHQEMGEGAANVGEFRQIIGVGTQVWRSDPGSVSFGEDTTDATTLAEDLDDSETEIDVASASAWPTNGVVVIHEGESDEEIVAYRGKSGNTIQNCTRGILGTDAAAHTTGHDIALRENPVLDLVGTGITQITSIVCQQQGSTEILWLSGASETGDHELWYSATYGADWLEHATLTGEALAVNKSQTGLTGGGTAQAILAGKVDGTLYRFRDGSTTRDIDTPGRGRIQFLAGEWTDVWSYGMLFLQGGRLYSVRWGIFSSNTEDTIVNQAEDLGYLYDGVSNGAVAYVTDGWNIYEITSEGALWIGMPPQFSGYDEVRRLALVGPNLVAALVASDGSTAVLSYPAIQRETPTNNPAGGGGGFANPKIGVPPTNYPVEEAEPTAPLDRKWSMMFTLDETVYDIYGAMLTENRATPYTPPSRTPGYIIAYDGTDSYVYSFPPTLGGVVLQGGDFPESASRQFPTFFGTAPENPGAFFSVVVAWEFIDTGGSTTSNKIVVERSIDGGAWTEVGTIYGNDADKGGKRGASEIELGTPLSYHALDLRVTIYRLAGDANKTKSPRIFMFGIVWTKRPDSRLTWAFDVDSVKWVEYEGGSYDGLLNTLQSLYDEELPLTLTIGDDWGELATSWRVEVDHFTPQPLEMMDLLTRGDVRVVCSEV